MKKIVSLCCAVSLVLAVGFMFIGCETYEFTDNEVLIVINKEATRSLYDYTAADFTDVGCIAIRELTALTHDDFVRAINGEPYTALIDVESYRRIYKLTLNKKSHANVLAAIRILKQRSDIEGADPNHTEGHTTDAVEVDG